MSASEEWVEATWGPMKLSPLRYQNLDVGPYTMRTRVLPGETHEQAFDRAFKHCERLGREAYKRQLTDFIEFARQASEAVR